MEMEEIKCTRCGRRLKKPFYVGESPYGKSCYKKVLTESKKEDKREAAVIQTKELSHPMGDSK